MSPPDTSGKLEMHVCNSICSQSYLSTSVHTETGVSSFGSRAIFRTKLVF